MAPVVRVEGVKKSFGNNVVLDGIDLTVNAAEALVIIGPSGSGKSTLLRCVNLLEPIDGGRIFFEGREITGRGTNVPAVQQQIGIVFQQFNLFPHLRVMENLTLAARRVAKLQRKEADLRARELLERVGLVDKGRSYPHQLSGGQQQRAAVQSVPQEQHEAAAALGFGWLGRHRSVIPPQALRRLLPPLVSLQANVIQNLAKPARAREPEPLP
jgi:polar amino acid transport system ATP-binding protein